jgi:plastocyanin
MRCRDVFLRIEPVPAYSPVAPTGGEHGEYGRDCMRNHGHEDARIPESEVLRRQLDGLVYRQYTDGTYTTPVTDPLVPSDLTEPIWNRRMPATVLWTQPGERLRVHVLNADTAPHSLHVHGLVYGVDSDGSWPFGVSATDGRRSDAICPGDSWCYVFDVTRDTVGAWPFHDHVQDLEAAVDRGLFGGIVVRDPSGPKPDVEVPFFLHRLVGSGGEPLFDSGQIVGGDVFAHTFPDAGTFDYVCRLHPMTGTVRVVTGGPATAAVAIVDTPTQAFVPDDVTVGPGGTVTWTHAGTMPHTVSDARTSPLDTFAINGRAYVGNTPIVLAEAGRRIRWYVFDLDLGERWHNFHTHGQRFRAGGEIVDTRSLGPAESFVADTVAPPVLLDPSACDPDLGHGDRRRYCLRGDFLVHCHVEMHMMSGMAAVVRSIQEVHLTQAEVDSLGHDLPIADEWYCRELGHQHEYDEHDAGGHGGHGGHGGGHGHGGVPDDCPDVGPHPCGHAGGGTWERLADLDQFVVHAAVLHTGKVLLWAGTAEVGDPMTSRIWDPATDARTGQAYGDDLFCAGHTFLADGTLLVAGGAPVATLDSTYLFDPTAETWTRVADMLHARWYPTVLPLPDGRILAASGSGVSEVEVYDPAAGTWQLVTGAARLFPELYPSLHLLPGGQIFYSRAGWAIADTVDRNTALLTLSGPLAGSWTPQGLQSFPDRQEGAAVLLIDTTVTPPRTEVVVVGGGVSGAPTDRNAATAERIDLTDPATATWDPTPIPLAFPRTNVNALALPDGHILVVGGQHGGKWAADPQPVLEAEILDLPTGTTAVTPPMQFPRQYHSIAVLLPDGRVLAAGGIDPTNPVERDQRSMEIYRPPYLDGTPRPTITAAPAAAAPGDVITVITPDAATIDLVSLVRPHAVTHHTDAGHRWIRLPITGTTAGSLDVRMPATAAVAPPGWYMFFLVNTTGTPSEAHWIQLG